MKKITVLSVALLAVGLAAFAETETSATIENVVVRQLWPWSGDVDIAFTVTGTKSTAVKFTAQYDGIEPYVIPESQLSGDFFDAAPGQHHVRWSTQRAGLDAKTLFNLKITVEPDDTDRTYLILNLYDGTYRYASAEPEGGWLADPANYQTNIVFRRIPKGTRYLGLSKEFDAIMSIPKYAGQHEVTLTSDYYLSVFMTTEAQRKYIDAKAKGETEDVSKLSPSYEGRTYHQLRGGVADGIDWPGTKHGVKPGTVIDNLRTIVKSSFPSGWIVDLPTSSQWEYAAKGTTPFDQLLSVGGKVTDGNFFENYTNLVDQVAIWFNNVGDGSRTAIGRKVPNGWGLYDIMGLGFEWVNDWAQNTAVDYSGVDPVGPASGTNRIRRSVYTHKPSTTSLIYYTTAYIGEYNPLDESKKAGYRLCINLKNMFIGK